MKSKEHKGTKSSIAGFLGAIMIALAVPAESTPGKALQFDGSDDYVRVADNAVFNTPEFTVEAWFKTSASGPPPSHNVIVDKMNDEPGAFGGWRIRTIDSEIRIDVGHGSTYQAPSTTGGNYNDDKWHHVALTFDTQDKYVVYADGNEILTDTCPATYQLPSCEPSADRY